MSFNTITAAVGTVPLQLLIHYRKIHYPNCATADVCARNEIWKTRRLLGKERRRWSPELREIELPDVLIRVLRNGITGAGVVPPDN